MFSEVGLPELRVLGSPHSPGLTSMGVPDRDRLPSDIIETSPTTPCRTPMPPSLVRAGRPNLTSEVAELAALESFQHVLEGPSTNPYVAFERIVERGDGEEY